MPKSGPMVTGHQGSLPLDAPRVWTVKPLLQMKCHECHRVGPSGSHQQFGANTIGHKARPDKYAAGVGNHPQRKGFKARHRDLSGTLRAISGRSQSRDRATIKLVVMDAYQTPGCKEEQIKCLLHHRIQSACSIAHWDGVGQESTFGAVATMQNQHLVRGWARPQNAR